MTKTDKETTAANESAHIIVLGNIKGGSGKSTVAMHTAIALLRMGYRIGTIDLDAQQGTLTRYLKNRFAYVARNSHDIPSPDHMALQRSDAPTLDARRSEDSRFLTMALDEMRRSCDFVVIDTPGADSRLSRMAHAQGDTLITPMNDSLIDMDVLADIDPETRAILKPSVYAKMVEGFKANNPDLRWIVLRNRLSPMQNANRKEIGNLLEKASETLGFTLAGGFSERTLFKDLFLKGLTLMDLKEDEEDLSFMHVAARQDVRRLIRSIEPESLKGFRTPPKSRKAV